MAEPEAPADKGANAPPKQARREKLIVGGTIVLVLLTYLLLRRASAQANSPSSNASTAAGIDPTTGLPYGTSYAGAPSMGYGSPATGNYLNPQDPTLLALEGQLSSIQSSLATVPSTSPGAGPSPYPVVTDGGSGPSGTPTPTTGPTTATTPPAVVPAGGGVIGWSGQPIGTFSWTSPGGPGQDPAGTHELTGYAPPPGVPYAGGYATPGPTTAVPVHPYVGPTPPALSGATATAYQTDPAVRNYLNALAAANKGH